MFQRMHYSSESRLLYRGGLFRRESLRRQPEDQHEGVRSSAKNVDVIPQLSRQRLEKRSEELQKIRDRMKKAEHFSQEKWDQAFVTYTDAATS